MGSNITNWCLCDVWNPPILSLFVIIDIQSPLSDREYKNKSLIRILIDFKPSFLQDLGALVKKSLAEKIQVKCKLKLNVYLCIFAKG
jgi:hypothetical protein